MQTLPGATESTPVFTDKHVLVALIVAPILALLAWFAVDVWLAEEPEAAQTGNSYPLIARSNCRWASGLCEMENEDFSVVIRLDGNTRLLLTSRHTLDGVMLVLEHSSAGSPPLAMSRLDAGGQRWAMPLSAPPPESARIRFVASASGRQFFGETGLAFTGGNSASPTGQGK